MVDKFSENMGQVTAASRESAVTVLRNKAKRLREQSHQLEKLADELSRFSFSHDAEEALWREVVSK